MMNTEAPTPRPAAAVRRVRRVVDLLEGAYGAVHRAPGGDGVGGLVRTILSQHTSDVLSARAFAALRRTLGTWEEVLAAPPPRVAAAIRGAGLARIKTRRIQAALEQILADRGELSLESLRGEAPGDARAYLEGLDGVGPKTAACVLMFNFGMPVLPVDTHVHRVSRRLRMIAPRVSAERAHVLLGRQVPDDLVMPFHLLVIQHGRRVCSARRPACGGCVVRRFCGEARPR